MKKLLMLLVLCFSLIGCQDLVNEGSHIISSTVGLNREIALYANDGSIIKAWKVKTKIETGEDSVGVRFMDENKKSVYISGTFIIQEF